MNRPLVSIIIPTYNRAHFIGETLDSVIAQTYQNWECIVVDDGSNDYTDELLEFYSKKETRIQYHHRPRYKPKGANACRNYGFFLSKGLYINWFDSDDVMDNDKIRFKVNSFSDDLDFVISNSLNFVENKNLSRPYPLNYNLAISPENYISQKIGWITNDVMLRRSSIAIEFNEALKSGQEYNFFCRYLYKTTKGVFLKKDLSIRRIHINSIQSSLGEDSFSDLEYLYNEMVLLDDLKGEMSVSLINRSLKRIVRLLCKTSKSSKSSKIKFKVILLLRQYRKFKSAFYLILYSVSDSFLRKGHYFYKKSIHYIDR